MVFFFCYVEGSGLILSLYNAFLTSTLSSSASPLSSFGHVFSMAVMYSSTGGCLGLMTNFGPLASNFSWFLVKGVSNRLMTHFLMFVLLLLFAINCSVAVGCCCWWRIHSICIVLSWYKKHYKPASIQHGP